jgi:radical SAM protein with 4Fe4S-binding SPASM domain
MIDFIEAIKTSFQLDKKFKAAEENGYNPINRKIYKQYNAFRPDGAKPIFCYLPYNSLTFSFGGKVYVCSYNRDIELGSYPQNTISEIWNGEEAKKLRQHMSNNDLDYGCGHCKFFFDKQKFSNLRPLVFDKYYENVNADFPQVFEFELSNECNLECQMCHGEVSSMIRKNRDNLPPLPMHYDDNFVEQLVPYIPHLKEAKFYGGEPFLIPIYYKIWDKIKQLNPKLDLFLITNGTHWNAKIEKLVTELNFDIAISIDAFDKEKLERIRKNVVYEKLMENIRRFSEICNKKGKHLSLSFTVQKDNWEQLPLVINLCNEVNAFIYVSYLERPTRFSIADMTTAELQEIRDYMQNVVLPKGTSKEKHNFKCFEDFKNYLDRYITNGEEKKYKDYYFQQNKEGGESQQSTSGPIDKSITASELELVDYLKNQYALNSSWQQKITDKDLIDKVNDTLAPFNNEEQGMLRGMMIQTDFRQIIEPLISMSVEQLTDNCRKTIQQMSV